MLKADQRTLSRANVAAGHTANDVLVSPAMREPPEPFLGYVRAYDDPAWREAQGPLGILRLGGPLKDALRDYEAQLVAEARKAGATWDHIGAALNTQKQNVHKRFRHVEEGKPRPAFPS